MPAVVQTAARVTADHARYAAFARSLLRLCANAVPSREARRMVAEAAAAELETAAEIVEEVGRGGGALPAGPLSLCGRAVRRATLAARVRAVADELLDEFGFRGVFGAAQAEAGRDREDLGWIDDVVERELHGHAAGSPPTGGAASGGVAGGGAAVGGGAAATPGGTGSGGSAAGGAASRAPAGAASPAVQTPKQINVRQEFRYAACLIIAATAASTMSHHATTHTIADPTPLGLASFAATTFVFSLVNTGERGVSTSNVGLGLALFYGGAAQIIAGMWDFARGNTFGATSFSSYGAFYLAYGAILLPGTGIEAAYVAADPTYHQLYNALAFFALGWVIFSVIMWAATARSSVAVSFLFLLITMDLVLLCGSYFAITYDVQTSKNLTKASGWVGILLSITGWYLTAAILVNPETSLIPFHLPVGHMGAAAEAHRRALEAAKQDKNDEIRAEAVGGSA
ncbi:hypothetical protein HK405_010360 [Cladochytrium tenue]|nr:hypothetical protein HK405_010360 [Cladochytrium tenue]